MLVQGDFVHSVRIGEVVILRNYLLSKVSSSVKPYRSTLAPVGVDHKGYIEHLAEASHAESLLMLARDQPIFLPKGSFLLPTFCDLHLHAPQYLYQGTGLHLPLMEWLNKYAFEAEDRLDADSQLAMKVYRRLAGRLVEHGTGAVLLFGTIRTETK